MKRMPVAGLVTAVFVALSAVPGQSADTNGNFAYKGAGNQTCGHFNAAWDGQSNDLLLYGGWLDGYLTAFNQFRDDTFDIAPWQTTQTMLGLVRSVCSQMPEDTPFPRATWQLLSALQPNRLEEFSTAMILTQEDTQVAIYEALLPRLLGAMEAAGYPVTVSPTSAAFMSQLAAGLRAIQASRGLKQTGKLDQQTLFTLLQTDLTASPMAQ